MRWTCIDDVPAWTVLTNVLAVADDTGEFYDEEDLAEELTEAGVDPQQDTWAVWDSGEMVAYGQVRVYDLTNEGAVRCDLSGGVLPSHRGRGIGRELLQRMESRAQQLARTRHPGVPIRLGVPGQGEGADVRSLLDRSGYRPVRYFTQMVIPDLAGAQFAKPASTVVPVDAADPAQREAIRVAHADSFRDHWGSTVWSPQKWDDFMLGRPFRGNQSRIAVDTDGTVLAFTLGSRYVEGEFYIGIVGTRRQARGRGLAKATLLGALAAAQEAGFERAELDVDSQNPTGALGLYEATGFTTAKVKAAYAKDLPANTVG